MGFLDRFTLAAYLAGVTTDLRFLSFSFVLPPRSFSVAKQVGTAAMLSGYRVVLGAGVGWLEQEMALMGHDHAPAARADEMLEIIRDFWDDGYAEHSGAFYDVPCSGMFPLPRQRIPVYIGGMSDASAAPGGSPRRMVGRLLRVRRAPAGGSSGWHSAAGRAGRRRRLRGDHRGCRRPRGASTRRWA